MLTLETIFIRLFIAMLLGVAIGAERQWRNHYAGLRTSALITIGAAGLVIFAEILPGADKSGEARIAGQIITGVGFLCAGVIMHEGINIKGLNTAATLWCSATVGMFAGGGLFTAGSTLAGFVIVTNFLLRPLVFYINNHSVISDETDRFYTLSFTCDARDEKRIRAVVMGRMGACAYPLRQLNSSKRDSQVCIRAELHFPMREDAKMEAFVTEMGNEDGILSAGWQLH